jgi:prevent-host-death family protein
MAADQVSVRELRQNLSVYLRQVQEGRTLAVTSRGERVALLSPIGGGSRFERLVAEELVSSPAQPWVEPCPVEPDGGVSRRPLTDALLEERAEQQF